MNKMQKVNRILLTLVIVGVALFVTKRLVTHKERPKRLIHASKGVVVDVETVHRTSLNLKVTGTGLVKPLQEAQIAPQVSGAVVFIAPGLVRSGFFKKGELLFKIEDTDSVLALEQARAELTKAKLDLALMEGQADIATQEWHLLNSADVAPRPLVVYEPQLASARAMVASAKAKVKLADLDIQRTTITAPFNCFVRDKKLDIGQYVREGTVVLNLVGTDQVEIIVPLPLADVAVVTVRHRGACTGSDSQPCETEKTEVHSGASPEEFQGSEVMVRMDVIGMDCNWQGYVDRFAGEMDPTTRMLDVIVVVDDPYALVHKKDHPMPLAVGSFVAVEIVGRNHRDVVEIPRRALRDHSSVWLAEADSTLAIRHVTVLRKNQETLIISDGLNDGDRVILTPLRGASPGMKLRVQEQNVEGGARP